MSIKRFFELREKVLSYDPEANTELLKKAYSVAAAAHLNKVRDSGEPYITHPLAVASILADMKLDEVTISAGLLHDVVADSDYSLDDIERLFGKAIGDLVSGVTKSFKILGLSENKTGHEMLRRMLLNISGDLRVIIIILANRLHDIRTLAALEIEKQKRIARETLDLYAPIAHRLGLANFKTEMENIAFKYAYPGDYETTKSLVEFNKEIGRQKLALVKNQLRHLSREK